MRTVLLGFGGMVDVEIDWDVDALASLADAHAITQADLDLHAPVVDARSLVASIVAFMQEGAGGERFVADASALDAVLSRFRHRWTLGGTGVRAALAMRALGVPSTVQLVSVDDTVRRLLPEGVEVVCSASEDSRHPHLIVQYPQGARVRTAGLDVTAPRANRLIYVNDPPNRELVLGDRLERMAPGVDVLLVSGLNTMQDERLLDDRIATIARILAAMPEHGVAVYEDAGYHVPEHGERVRAALAPLVDVASMNEDELASLLGRSIDLLDPVDVESALVEARARLGARTLVVHTQGWAAATGERAVELLPAIGAGIEAAATRYVAGDAPTDVERARVVAAPRQPRGAELIAALESRGTGVVGLPAPDVHPERATTIGLGDTFVGGFIASIARAGIKEGADA